ncbi:hypothetical protein JOF56_011318 [Kibdelosporangium banguiense]|uniref:Uncharacterized protein n=1 Tax=Kibdelosporangium banguiense TaxID=1365924 RepID=A0ABS4U2P6_9PSEU|nr:hypothetical protein [Kibdelosporangium banguiense]MBP2330933.1 hypothetical protein [Kibdelosporangium banguiense]
MRRLATVGASVVLLALSAACGAQTAPGSAPPPQSQSELPSETPPADPSLPGEVPGGAKLVTKLDAAKLPEGYPRKVWTEGDGSRIGLTAQEGGCGRASVEITDQHSPDKLVLTLVETTPAAEMMCTMDMRYPAFTVALNAPLGERTVVLDYQQRKS